MYVTEGLHKLVYNEAAISWYFSQIFKILVNFQLPLVLK